MAAYSKGPSWSFPEHLPGSWSSEPDRPPSAHADPRSGPKAEPEQKSSPKPQRRHYPSRQCRICLEVVQPTFHTNDESSFSDQSLPRVTYASEDGGRLMSPCNCKGSQKYVHENCLGAWRRADPTQRRNYWECPTCGYRYRLQRLTWSSWIASTSSQIALTLLIFITTVFVLGFIADPIINMYLDPIDTITTAGGRGGSLIFEDQDPTWAEHFVKGLASLGLLGFAKLLLSLSPFHFLNIRSTGGVFGGRRAVGGTGRDRLAQLSWITLVIGIVTFIWAVWKVVRAWSKRTLEHASERVLDVPGSDADDDGDD